MPQTIIPETPPDEPLLAAKPRFSPGFREIRKYLANIFAKEQEFE